MSTLDEQWLQDIAESLGIPALGPNVVKMTLPIVEAHLKKITQQAHKFQRHSKAKSMTVDDVNAALALNKVEPIYGLSRPEHAQILSTNLDGTAGVSSSAASRAAKKMVNLVEFGKSTTLVPCPLRPEVSLHWLAVNGSQPATADNPSVVVTEGDDVPITLTKELQNLYARIVGILLSADASTPSSTGLSAVLTVLRSDPGIQELAPYLSRCFYQQVRANGKRLSLLNTIIAAIKALLKNPAVDLEFHLQQLMPAVFTCVVAAKLSASPSEDHWSLRSEAADVVALIGAKYSTQFPELHARMCKTYLEALGPDKALGTLYGALVGLSALGTHVVRTLLLPNLAAIQDHLQGGATASSGSTGTASGSGVAVSQKGAAGKRKRSGSMGETGGKSTAGPVLESAGGSRADSNGRRSQEDVEVNMCRQALLRALGKYVVHCMKLPDLGRSTLGGGPPSFGANSTPPLCDLEEALVPYYAAASRQDYYCRLSI